MYSSPKVTPSEKKSTHATAHSLTIAQNVEFGDELMQVVTGLSKGSQVGLKKYIVVLLEREREKRFI